MTAPFEFSSLLDRAAHRRADARPTTWVVVRGGDLAVDADGGPLFTSDALAGERVYLGMLRGEDIGAVVVPPVEADAGDDPATDGFLFASLRDVIGTLSRTEDTRAELELAFTAVALGQWRLAHRRCPRCGTPTEARQGGWVLWCEVDKREWYPRTDPAVIVAITDPDDRLLIAHASLWSARRFSLLAGYVEPGESLEQAVHREVAEEASLSLHNLTYIGSQPWPFPASLMAGFTATVTDPEFTLDTSEISEAMWVTRPELAALVASGEVLLAPHGSIARRMVEEWYGAAIPN